MLFQSVSVLFIHALLHISLTSHSRIQSLASTASTDIQMHGNEVNSQMQKPYHPSGIVVSPVELLFMHAWDNGRGAHRCKKVHVFPLTYMDVGTVSTKFIKFSNLSLATLQSVALVGKGKKDSGCRVCEIASLRFPSDYFSLLVKVCESAQPWPSVPFSGCCPLHSRRACRCDITHA